MRIIVHKGGEGSGDFGHKGRPGLVGGSSSSTGRKIRLGIIDKAVTGNITNWRDLSNAAGISASEATHTLRVIKKANITREDLQRGKVYMAHLLAGYNIRNDAPNMLSGDYNRWQDIATILYREWPKNTSRMKTDAVLDLLERFGYGRNDIVLAKLEQERMIAWEQIADLDQVGLNPAYIKG